MPEGTVSTELEIRGMRCASCAERLRTALAAVPGILHADARMGAVRIEYLPEAVSLPAVRDLVASLGYEAPVPGNGRGPWRRFLDRMIADNQRRFGNERLDCCTMGRRRP